LERINARIFQMLNLISLAEISRDDFREEFGAATIALNLPLISQGV
jgi:hypothetical protein